MPKCVIRDLKILQRDQLLLKRQHHRVRCVHGPELQLAVRM